MWNKHYFSQGNRTFAAKINIIYESNSSQVVFPCDENIMWRKKIKFIPLLITGIRDIIYNKIRGKV